MHFSFEKHKKECFPSFTGVFPPLSELLFSPRTIPTKVLPHSPLLSKMIAARGAFA